jgi:membrane associated rhomboid family serine protease
MRDSFETIRERGGLYYDCQQCHGRAATVSQVRRTTGDRFAATLMRKVNHSIEISLRTCPFCSDSMKVFQLTEPAVTLHSCKHCTAIWFDPGTFEQLPEGIILTEESLMMNAMEATGKWRIEEQKLRNRASSADAPDATWKWFPAFFGFPIKFNDEETSRRPWATWTLSLLITGISICAFVDLKEAVDTFGMIPAQAGRYGGLTFLTSFFIHAGLMHLAGNLYFFLLFGGEVEEFLGSWRFLILIFLSAFIGDGFHILGNLGSTEPCIGASGGISGVLVFYALKFPKGTISFFNWRLGWIHLPAWVAFILWFLLQLFGIEMQKAGLSNVAALAHVGGVVTGFVLWLVWRNLGLKNANQEDRF